MLQILQKYFNLVRVLPFLSKIVQYWSLLLELIELAEAVRGPRTGQEKKDDVLIQFKQALAVAVERGVINQKLANMLIAAAPWLIDLIVDAVFPNASGGATGSTGSTGAGSGTGEPRKPPYLTVEALPYPDDSALLSHGYIEGDAIAVNEAAGTYMIIPRNQPTLGSRVVHRIGAGLVQTPGTFQEAVDSPQTLSNFLGNVMAREQRRTE